MRFVLASYRLLSVGSFRLNDPTRFESEAGRSQSVVNETADGADPPVLLLGRVLCVP